LRANTTDGKRIDLSSNYSDAGRKMSDVGGGVAGQSSLDFAPIAGLNWPTIVTQRKNLTGLPFSAWFGSEPCYGLQDLLQLFNMDVAYERAAGDYLFQRRGSTLEPVLDLIGGFGTTLLGHNHPELIEEARRLLAEGVPFSAQPLPRLLRRASKIFFNPKSVTIGLC
jgi:hypothetical protein